MMNPVLLSNLTGSDKIDHREKGIKRTESVFTLGWWPAGPTVPTQSELGMKPNDQLFCRLNL